MYSTQNRNSTKAKSTVLSKGKQLSNGTLKKVNGTARKSAGRLDKLPDKNVNNVFQQITCTGATPGVVDSVVRKPGLLKRPFGASAVTYTTTSRPSQNPSSRKVGLKLTPVHSALKPARHKSAVPLEKSFRELKLNTELVKVTPRATTAVLRPCKCPACTKKRASGVMDNLHADGHVPQVSPKVSKDYFAKPLPKTKETNKFEKSPVSVTQKVTEKENFENVSTWQVIDNDKKANGPTSFLRSLFNKPIDKVNDPIAPSEKAEQNVGQTEIMLKNSKEESSSELMTLGSVSVNLPSNQSSVYGIEREESLATQCESFHFVEMPHSLITKDNADDAPFIVLKDNSSKNLDVIRSKLGSRNGQRPQAVIEWKKGEMLGRGAFGTVWCGLTITGELIAVKQAEISSIDIEKANKEYEKVQQEVELLKSLHHNNIVGYLGTCLDGRVVSIFMQYIPGGSLTNILKKFGPLAEPVISRYTKQILEGVAYLHSKNVIHRDLKGSNIMLVPNGVIKLIDFGCAKKLMNITKSNAEILKSMKGTPYWMAPEVINETGHGKKSDVWSIGCTVYEMATAKPPWSDMHRYAALYAISSATTNVPKLHEKFSGEAKDFVSVCLKREPKERSDVDKLLQHKFILDYWQPESRIQDSRCIPLNKNKKL